ncbi:hypothetical protein BB559_001897 [Furculomyces boomerangus]|uniref:Potassium channel domain-containing protein n=1 Tax=Furculomyces boomerangus TaxID=61424 RepID=A0A2T9YZS7_9FUNG|nr:hypothetical protein BB559_001897 [Furculomyces boomerangus]
MNSSENNNFKQAHIDIHDVECFPSQNLQHSRFELPLSNPNSQQNSQNEPYKKPKKKSNIRWVISLAGFITPITLLLNGMFLTSSWFGDADSVEYSNVRICLFCSFVAATIAFLYRSLEYDVVKTTFLTVLFSTICGLGSIILAIILPNIGKYKNLKSIINKDYYGSFFASSLTLLVAGLLIYDYIVTENFSMKGSGMTKRQRRLHFSVLAVYIWTAIGAGVFMLIEKFEFSFAVYFCFVTITTIGFGDITPQNTSTKILTLVWLFIGVIIFGIYLLSARDVVAQILFKKYRKRIRWKVFHYNLHNKYANNSSAKIHSDTSYKTHPSRNHDLEAETSNTKKKIRGLFASMCLPFQLLRSLVRNFKFPKKFPIKRLSKNQLKLKKLRMHAFSFLVINLNLWFVCSLVFYFLENGRWTYPQALYFCFVSFTTVGYGDVTPSSKLSIIFFNFIIVIAVSNFAGYLGSVVELFQYLILSLLENNIIRHVQPEYNNNRKHFRLLRKILPNPSQNESNNDKFSTIFYPRSISEQSLELENENTNIGDYDIEKYSIRAASLPDIWPRKDI